MHPEDAAFLRDKLYGALAEGVSGMVYRFRLERGDGDGYIWLEDRATCFYEADGAIEESSPGRSAISTRNGRASALPSRRGREGQGRVRRGTATPLAVVDPEEGDGALELLRLSAEFLRHRRHLLRG